MGNVMTPVSNQDSCSAGQCGDGKAQRYFAAASSSAGHAPVLRSKRRQNRRCALRSRSVSSRTSGVVPGKSASARRSLGSLCRIPAQPRRARRARGPGQSLHNRDSGQRALLSSRRCHSRNACRAGKPRGCFEPALRAISAYRHDHRHREGLLPVGRRIARSQPSGHPARSCEPERTGQCRGVSGRGAAQAPCVRRSAIRRREL